jgi:hypothetical protein
MSIDDIATTLTDALAQVGPRLTRSRLSDVAVSIDRERAPHLAEFIFGSITWSTKLGRPDAPTLASGFKITHEYFYLYAVALPDGSVNVRKGYSEADDVSAWDAQPAGDVHQVNFIAPWHALPPNRFSVDFVPMAWRDHADDPRFIRGVRSVRPHSMLTSAPSGITFLEFEVVEIPLLDIERAGVLAEG